MTNHDPDSLDFFSPNWITDDPFCLDCGRAITAKVPEALQPHRHTQCQECYDEAHAPQVTIMYRRRAWGRLFAAVWGRS